MTVKAQLAPTEKPIPCIARQPILTPEENVIGYELFLRESQLQNRARSDPEQEAAATIDMLNLLGLGILCDGRLAFINCTLNMLLSDYLALLPPSNVVVELQENIPTDEKVILKCKALKQAGYSIALDHFMPGDRREALIPYARFIKIDITQVPGAECALVSQRYANENCRMVARKVETREQFLQAAKHGFTRFQGYYFRQPENLQTRQIPANQATYVRLLSAVSKPEIDFAEIEELVKHEPSLCYRLLRYLNSPLLGLSAPVTSVRNALSLLGEHESVRWIRMATTSVMGQEKTSDLVLASLVRARFCELIGARVKHGDADLFFMGMLSLIDSVLSLPIGMVINNLSIDDELKRQLLGARTGKKTSLSPIYDLMLAQEGGDWVRVAHLGKQMNLSLAFVAETSNTAMRWAHEVTGGARAEQPH